MARAGETEKIKIWKDADGKLWTLADSGIDTEIFELVGVPILDQASGLWNQQIKFRIESQETLQMSIGS